MKKLYTLLLIGFLLTGIKTNAQFCIDSLSISPGYDCGADYQPVCGCDGKTYRNICDAKYHNGVQYWNDGPCSGFEFDLIPTYVGRDDILKFTFVQNKGVTATMYIFDYFGKVIHQQILPASDNFTPPFYQMYIDVTNYQPGVYIVALTNSKGDYRYKKFVRFY